MNAMNEKDQDQLKCTILNVTHYSNFDDFTAHENMDGAEFIEAEESGFMQEITLGTYNGATDTFQARTMDDSHILEAILTDINESDCYSLLDGREAGNEQEEMTQAEYIRAYTEVYNVFTLDGGLYVNKD